VSGGIARLALALSKALAIGAQVEQMAKKATGCKKKRRRQGASRQLLGEKSGQV
jgi:hypothetical protein